jgi:hypothetical protein
MSTDFAPQGPDQGSTRGEYGAMAEKERDELQATVDASERDVEVRYVRWQELMNAVADAARRADAMFRLEKALELTAAR